MAVVDRSLLRKNAPGGVTTQVLGITITVLSEYVSHGPLVWHRWCHGGGDDDGVVADGLSVLLLRVFFGLSA